MLSKPCLTSVTATRAQLQQQQRRPAAIYTLCYATKPSYIRVAPLLRLLFPASAQRAFGWMLLTRNVLGCHRPQRRSQCHTRARLDLFVIRSRRTRLRQNNLQSSRGTARLRQMLRMRAVVKKPRWPHLRFFRPPQGCAHGPKPPARPVHDSRLCVVHRSAPARHLTRCFAATRRNRFLRGIYRL